MDRVHRGKPGTRRRWQVGSLCVLPALLLLVWTADAPALTRDALDIQPRPTLYAGEHSLALKADGSLWAWGINSYGAVGDGTTGEHLVPVRVGTDTDWATVAGGSGFSLALKSDGTLWTWGSNLSGQLGDGTTTERHAPARVGTDASWVRVAGGSDHCLALKSDGALWAWGANQHGQLGDGTTTARSVPTRVGVETDWVMVACGSGFSLALKSDGTLWAWGNNHSGQLGDGTTTERHAPTRVGAGTDADTGWASVACGSGYCLALKSEGTLWAWGANQYGQLGDGTTDDRHVATAVQTDAGWVAVAGGSDHSLAVRSDGTLWTWGSNVKGELGDGTTIERHDPARVGSETTWVSVAGGGFGGINGGVSMCLRSDGSLWTWGYGRHGEVGDGQRANRLTPFGVLQAVKLPVSSSSFTDIPSTSAYYKAIAAMADAGAIGGYPDGTFRPNNLVTRQQFAKMIVGAMALPVTEDDWQDADPPFSDCGPDDLANVYPHDYIAVAKAHNLTAGKTASTFAPRATITRAQVVTMVVRAAEYCEAAQNSGIELAAVDAVYAGTFEDYQDLVHGTNVRLADHNGLLQGLAVTGDPSAWITGHATRGEVAQVLWNLMKLRTD